MLSDLRFGLRTLRQNPGFALVAVLTLTLGIGANTALFSVVNGVLLRPLPYPEPDRLVQLWETSPANASLHVSRLNFFDWRDAGQSFAYLAAYVGGPVTITGGDLPVRTEAMTVTRDFFKVMGAGIALGRTFRPEDHVPGGDAPVILSYGLWQRAFGSEAKVIGKSIRMSGIACHVVRVAPEGFQFPCGTDLWAPSEILGDDSQRSAHNYEVVGRLKSGVPLPRAQAEMQSIARRLEQQYADSNHGIGVRLVPLRDQIVGGVKAALVTLLAAVGFVLLIACANFANLLLVRATARSREMAVRAALGASRGRLIRQLLSESLVLSALGGAGGLLLATWAARPLTGLLPASMPRAGEIIIDARVLWFTLGASAVTAILFGLLPAIRISRADLNASLKEAAGRSSTAHSRRAGGILVMAELALSMMLLIAAGLLIRSFFKILQVDPGFRAEHVLTAQLSLPVFSLNGPTDREPLLRFYEQLLDGVGSIPGVVAAGEITELPFATTMNRNGLFEIEGRPAPGGQSSQSSGYRTVSPSYFHAMGIPLLAGRDFTSQDAETAPQAVIVSQSMVRRFWPESDGRMPLGRRIRFLGFDEKPMWMTIVGVVGDVRELRLTHEPAPETYVPYRQHANGSLADPNLVVRTTESPSAIAAAIRAKVRALDKDVPVEFGSMSALLAESVSQQRFQMRLFALFAVFAMVLAGVGVYGVISYSVGLRTHEIGIRMALGADGADVVRLVVAQGLQMAVWGIAAGLVGALALHRSLENLLYGVSGADLLTYLTVSLLLASIALAATWIPARRATRVDPLAALRHQ